MLKSRVIPILLWDHFGLVKGKNFKSSRRVGVPLPAVQVYNQRDVDELIFLDIKANSEQSEPDYHTISDLASVCFVPLTVGGGITSVTHIRKLLLAGADKISLNTVCFYKPELIQQASDSFGSQCIVASIDYKKTDAGYFCYSHSGQTQHKIHPVEWAQQLERLGVGELLVTSIDLEGTMQGYDVPILQEIVKNVKIPVIASGGAGNAQHMLQALQVAKAHAVSAASLFHFTEQTPKDMKLSLKQAGVPVRLS